MESLATVIRIEGSDAVVEVAPAAAGCGRCHESGGCGSGLLANPLKPQCRKVYRLPNHIGAVEGDAVLLSVPEGVVLQAALLAYLLPVLLVIGGAVAGTVIWQSDPAALMGAALGLALGLLVLRVVQSRMAARRELLFTMRLEEPSKISR